MEYESASLAVTLAAASHFKREMIKLNRKGGTSVSSIDKNITFTCQDGWNSKSENLSLQVTSWEDIGNESWKPIHEDSWGIMIHEDSWENHVDS